MFKRKIPLIITFIMGIVMVAQFFIPNEYSKEFFKILVNKWLVIIESFFLIIGLASLLRLHYFKVSHQREGWGYSIITFAGIIGMCLLGFVWGTIKGSPFSIAFDKIIVPLNSTMFSILAFYMASAAFRAFRARTVVATILLITAVVVMCGRITVGSPVTDVLSQWTEWIMTVPNLAQKRGIMFGVMLGVLATSLKIIFGIERSYLGSKE